MTATLQVLCIVSAAEYLEGEEDRKRPRVEGLLATGDETLLAHIGCPTPMLYMSLQ